MEEQQQFQHEEHTHTRRVAQLFADECISAVTRRVFNNIDDKFLVEVEHDSVDLSVRDDRSTLEIRSAQDLTIPVTELQDLQVEVSIRGDSECSDLELEACTYTTDDDELIRDAIIRVEITIPTQWVSMDVLSAEITAALVHELRHAVQHCVWSWMPETRNDERDPEYYLFCPQEIDARVEEICSYSSLTLSQMTSDVFESLSRKYLKDYIAKNGLNDRSDLLSQALNHHLGYWLMRSQTDEFSRPS